MNTDNINKLTENKENFLRFAKRIEDKFDGPSAYFYLKAIEKINSMKKDYPSLFEDNNFFEVIYATLACWGMHRMDKNTRMTNFDAFKKSIILNKNEIIKLSKERLASCDLNILKSEILKIFNSLRIMSRKSSPKFVANSKVMHFVLPDLIPPMDKGHILYFFYGRINDKGKKYIPLIKNEEKVFWDILLQFQLIAKKLRLENEDLINDWDTSVPKVIDNAIIGFNISNIKD